MKHMNDRESSLVSILRGNQYNSPTMSKHEDLKETASDNKALPVQPQKAQLLQDPQHHHPQHHQKCIGTGHDMEITTSRDDHDGSDPDALSVSLAESDDSESSIELDDESPFTTSPRDLHQPPKNSAPPPITTQQASLNNMLPLEVVHLNNSPVERHSYSHFESVNFGSGASCASSISSSSHSFRNSRRKQSQRRASKRPASARMVDNFFNHGASFISQNSGSSGNDNTPKIPPRRLSNGNADPATPATDDAINKEDSATPVLPPTYNSSSGGETSILRPSLRRGLSCSSCGSSIKSGKSSSSRKSVRFQTPPKRTADESRSNRRRSRHKEPRARRNRSSGRKKLSLDGEVRRPSCVKKHHRVTSFPDAFLGSNKTENELKEDVLIFDNSGFDPSMSTSDLSSCGSSVGSFDSEGSGHDHSDGNESDDLAHQLALLDAQISIPAGRKSWATM
mmetsp:Transcript_20737/g.44891  ORF Transcript_20737/g.44891 Transcript_20737/m.44891 type:complete len:452 (-) Transcript_20737:57-1412(-)